ncbi:MAG: hypothetical protein KC502_00110 [Myxococcales bacterium]|nr:hypothetical protein [Myxococcales bacterium]
MTHLLSSRLRRLSKVLVVALLAGAVAAPASAQTVKKSVKKKPWPIGGMVTVGTTAGLGTFVPGESNRPMWSSNVRLMARHSPMAGLTLMASQGITKTFVTNVDDPFAARKRDTTLGDTVLIASWTPMIQDAKPKKKKKLTAKQKAAAAAAAALNPMLVSGGKGHPLMLPGGIRLSFLSVLSLPTSRIAQYQGRMAVLAGAANFSRRVGPVNLTYQARFTKNFHRYSNAVVPAGDNSELARAGGAEAVSDSQVATAFNNISFNVRNMLIASIPGPGKLSFQAVWLIINNFRYYDAPVDEFTSANAKGGRGRLDLSWASLSANYVFKGGYIASLSLATFQTPKTADNSMFRFPFFDFRSTPDNLTSLGLSVTKMF